MTSKSIVFTSNATVGIEQTDFDENLQPTEAIIKSLYTLICAGTELANWKSVTGPSGAGYTGVVEVVKVGEAVTDYQAGDILFAYGARHSSHVKLDITKEGVPYFKIPENIAPKLVPFIRLAAISMTSVRASDGELGDTVAIQGLGLVGNLAAQLFALSGLNVIGIDVAQGRLDAAEKCGIPHLINPAKTDLKQKVKEITGGAGCEVTVDAIGNPALVQNLCEIAGRLGEVILLGSPRGEYMADITPLLNYVHLWPQGSLTFKGAHEWRYPLLQTGGGKHSIERNVRIIFDLVAEGKLNIEPLMTHVVPPENAEEAYKGLLDKKDEYLGVLFDWTY